MNVFAVVTVVADLAAACCALAFVAMYARRGWWRSRTGTNLMLMSTAVAVAAILAASAWLVVSLGETSWFSWLAPIAAVVWAVIAGGFLARIADLKRAERDGGSE